MICIPGGSNPLLLFSYREITLSSNYETIDYSVDSTDSSGFRFLGSFADLFHM